jgi:lipoate---protein ligase
MSSIMASKTLTRRLSPTRLAFSRFSSSTPNPFTNLSDSPLQIYRSRSLNPYENLSIEHYLFSSSHPESTVLFLYTNTPSVIIGRNQNPWLEADLSLLRAGLRGRPVPLIRRRSGGGAVFHDEGNANWCVICPPRGFTRDAHGEMVVRALRALGVASARVNARHDIVAAPAGAGGEVKVSGSAYKLTRTRAMHHGTCLLRSPNLSSISAMLRSPAQGWVKARGVESVRSKVGNVGVGMEEFYEEVGREFRKMYPGDCKVVTLEEGGCEVAEKMKQFREEIISDDWTYGQTPKFSFSSHPEENTSAPTPIPSSLPTQVSNPPSLQTCEL